MKEVDEAAVNLVETEAIGVELQQFVAKVIGKVRTVVKMFRKSPLTDEILHKHIQAQLNTELKLILDSKTRWNSLLEMIKIFVRAEKCIRMALVEIGTSTTITNAEIKIIHDLIQRSATCGSGAACGSFASHLRLFCCSLKQVSVK